MSGRVQVQIGPGAHGHVEIREELVSRLASRPGLLRRPVSSVAC